LNYDHDGASRRLETYWIKEWNAVVENFAEMKQLGANTVRIHLQTAILLEGGQQEPGLLQPALSNRM
jgi:hypothetical protein